MENIHILPTDKPSVLYKRNDLSTYHLGDFDICNPDNKVRTNQHIYITSDEKIKEGDYVYENNLNNETSVYRVEKRNDKLLFFRFRNVPIWLDKNKHNCKKIILTTDQDLIKDGVQEIPNEFLEWFVNNLSCEEVEVEPYHIIPSYLMSNKEPLVGYKIIIPKEELKQECICDSENDKWVCTINCKNKESKQETLEKVTKECLKENNLSTEGDFAEGYILGGIFGAKWQAERMYSEKEVENIAWSAWYESQFQKLEDKDEQGFIKWFEQFKKK